MRTTDGLQIINDISILIKYLYIDEDNFIIVENSIGIKSKITLDEQLNFKRQILNGIIPGQIMNCGSDMTVEFMKNLIGYLKEQPAEIFPDYFNNRWDEIKRITKDNLGLTAFKQSGYNRNFPSII